MALDEPSRFDKSQQNDKLTIKNHIAYHFKKIVQEVEQEMFISRKIDLRQLFAGSLILNQTASSLLKYCESQKRTIKSQEVRLLMIQSMFTLGLNFQVSERLKLAAQPWVYSCQRS